MSTVPENFDHPISPVSLGPVGPATHAGLTKPERKAATARLLLEAASAPPDRRHALLDEVVRLNVGVAREVAQRYRNRGIALDDLVQVASLALVKAARGYDPARGSDFMSYAVPTMRGEVRKTFRDSGWVVRPPRGVQELQAAAWRAEQQLTQLLQRSPRPAEVAEHLGVEVSDVLEALAVDGCFAPTSLDAPLGEGSDEGWSDRLAADENDLEAADARVMLVPAIQNLAGRDRRILELRYFAGWTQAQIGAEIGVTQMQVSRLLTRILRDLRSALASSPQPV